MWRELFHLFRCFNPLWICLVQFHTRGLFPILHCIVIHRSVNPELLRMKLCANCESTVHFYDLLFILVTVKFLEETIAYVIFVPPPLLLIALQRFVYSGAKARTISLPDVWWEFKARSHGTMCDCDLLYQEMECCLRFNVSVHMVWWVWMRFVMYLHWTHTLQLHRMGMVPIHVQHHTHHCIASMQNCTM